MSVSESSWDTDSTDSLPPSASPSYEVEFRSNRDDAWYSARVVVVEGEDKIRLKYHGFGDEEDDIFDSRGFETLEEVKLFENRFRPISTQLQDSQCGKVVQGTHVCASHPVFSSSDVRFYDAVVDDVIYKEHLFANGEEECLCTFVVIWMHGPLAGCLANKKIEHICLVLSSGLLDPALTCFLDIVRNRVVSDVGVCNYGSTRDKGNARLATSPVSSGSQRLISQVMRKEKLKSIITWESDERLSNFSERCKEDVDIGGDVSYQILLIDNMDKDLFPSSIMEFIHRQTSVPVEAYVFPSLSSETYTRGAILLDSKRNLQKLTAFLDSPNHIVVSCMGSACRPWVLCDTSSGYNAFIMANRSSMTKYKDKQQHRSTALENVLKVVCIGSEEYNTAKQLKELFIEFAANQRRLHKRLALEERMILHASKGLAV